MNILIEQQSENIKNLFINLPLIGYGDSKIFNNTQQDIDFAYETIKSVASIGLIIRRCDYLEKGGEKSINEYYHELQKEDNFQSYMLNNFDLINDEFIFEKSLDKLNFLSGILLNYYL